MKNLKMMLSVVFIIISSAAFAQHIPDKLNHANDSILVKKGEYYCMMHPEVQSKKPSKCTKCGRVLNLSTKEQMKYSLMKLYTCPMHPKEISNKPGRCTKCGTNLVVKKNGVLQ